MNKNANTSTLIERLKDARVLTVGDIMLDRYVMGSIDRISPEAHNLDDRMPAACRALGDEERRQESQKRMERPSGQAGD